VNDLIFVYGTLRPGVRNSRFELFADGATLVSLGRVRGHLYDLGDYPGMVLDAGNDWVTGEVYALLDPETTLYELDVYEGATARSDDDFERALIVVTLEDERDVEVWTYLYRGPLAEARLMPSGDYAEASLAED
jgi:gamma-glutamylcyclotransferase (GGCT)/AIG2-like uncharacterized protein YtfP